MIQASPTQHSQNRGRYYSFGCPVCQRSFIAPVPAVDARIQCPCSYSAVVGDFDLLDAESTPAQQGQSTSLPLPRPSPLTTPVLASMPVPAPTPAAPTPAAPAADGNSLAAMTDYPSAAGVATGEIQVEEFDLAGAALTSPAVKTYTPFSGMQVKSEMSMETKASGQLNLEHFDHSEKLPSAMEQILSERFVRYGLLALALAAFAGIGYFVVLSFMNESTRGKKTSAKITSLAMERELIENRNKALFEDAQRALAAVNWQDLLEHVRFPEKVKPSMQYLYETKGVPYRPVNLIQLDKVELSQSEGVELYRLFANAADGRKLKLMMENAGGEKGWLLDWEYYVNIGDFQWQRFLAAPPGEKLELRVSLSDAYVWPAFCKAEGVNPDFAAAFTIRHPGPKSDTFIAVMERYNPVARELNSVLQSSSLTGSSPMDRRRQVIPGLELRLVPRVIAIVSKSDQRGPGMRLVHVHEVVQRGWSRLPDNGTNLTGVQIEARLETGGDVEPVIADHEPSLGRQETGVARFLRSEEKLDYEEIQSAADDKNSGDTELRIRQAADLRRVPPSTDGTRDDLNQD